MTRSRIALYAHDTVGLGHTRRQLAIAAAISARREDVDLLLLAGNPEAARLPLPPRLDLVTLPTVTKDPTGRYVPRRQGGQLADVLALRRAILTAALTAFDPQLLLVDKVPAGLEGELLPALDAVGGRTRLVLGLREVLDSPAAVAREWRRDGTARLLENRYDEVWVYGDPAVYDPVREYGFSPRIAARTHQLGYLGTWPSDADRPHARPYVLCQLGGGADAAALALAFAAAPLPDGHDGILLAGPFLPEPARAQLHALASDRLIVHDFVDNAEEFLQGAAAVVSMGGFNSTVEILSSDVPALVVPRVVPRQEQLLRARALSRIGALDVLEPDALSPAQLSGWLAEAVRAEAPAVHRIARARIDLDGLPRVARRATDLIEEARHAA
ncbi:glycosyltransferase family protein [Brachybacterium hainanense]|uniref:Glycosyltransferase family protein n=1 Tax=Brachybacterium hainanense TaxID=1541174 RepID=A0ABV6RCM0_9MICO